jgi:hypothetical protein
LVDSCDKTDERGPKENIKEDCDRDQGQLSAGKVEIDLEDTGHRFKYFRRLAGPIAAVGGSHLETEISVT